jgi:tRNA-dihydrouridine synthase 1
MNLKSNNELREQMATSHKVEDFRNVVGILTTKYQPFHEGHQPWTEELEEFNQLHRGDTANLLLPPWLCQPYVRMAPEKHIEKLEAATNQANHPDTVKRQFFDDEGNEISRKKMKKLRRKSRRPRHGEVDTQPTVYCKNVETDCTNTMGTRCDYQLCRVCCRDKCYFQNVDCVGHKCLIKSRREKAIYFEKLEVEKTDEAGESCSKDEKINC